MSNLEKHFNSKIKKTESKMYGSRIFSKHVLENKIVVFEDTNTGEFFKWN